MRTLLGAMVLACSISLLAGAAEPASEEGFVPIFDGESLEGWEGDLEGTSAKDGILIHKEGRLFTKKEYMDFILRFEFKTVKGGNNGVAIRSPLEGNPAYDGMEIQILDHDDARYADIKPYQVHGSIYGVVPAKRVKLKPEGEWNTEEIRAEGGKIKVTLNGEVIVDADISDIKETVDGRPHPGLHNKMGHIGFLGHGFTFEFRNLRILELAFIHDAILAVPDNPIQR